MIEAWFDGCCEPINPGGTASYGAVVQLCGKTVWQCSEICRMESGKERETSNNLAEYGGFLAILKWLLDNGHGGSQATIYGDSKLVIEQMTGRWRIRKGAYVPTALKAKGLLSEFKVPPRLKWIPREENEIADRLSKAELLKAGIPFRIQPEPDDCAATS